MIYQITNTLIPQDQRESTNQEILSSILTGQDLFSKEDIFNSYTGKGGLHNLKRKDYDNFNDYTNAKKEIEVGQFFTPHPICKEMVEIAAPEPTEMVLDMCCGMGNFFNYLPNLSKTYGFDIDENAVTVAKHLYPEANINVGDIRQYNPEEKFDIILGNPPFNLNFKKKLSQYFFCEKAYQVLNPAGLLLLVVPESFMFSDFWNKRQVAQMNKWFSFIGQTRLDKDAFSFVGVDNFNTKIMAFTRFSGSIENKSYEANEFITLQQLKKRVETRQLYKKKSRLKILRESKEREWLETGQYEEKIKKYLYEIDYQPRLWDYYDKAQELIKKFREQEPPEGCSQKQYEDWEKSKLTYPKVVGILKRYIKRQNYTPEKRIALVKQQYGFKLKAYAPRMLEGIDRQFVSIRDAVAYGVPLPEPPEMTDELEKQYKIAKKLIKKKKREYQLQQQEFSVMERDPLLDMYINQLTFLNKELKACHFTSIQKEDMGLVFQKRYGLLNWQPGSGKTAPSYYFGKYNMDRKRVKNTIILAPTNAVELTWVPFLERNKARYMYLTTISDFYNIPEGVFLVITLNSLEKLKIPIRKLMRKRSNKVCLIFDESDEITNSTSQCSILARALFRRTLYTLLATGTTTRNCVSELYPQLEILYNNSVNMLCECFESYYEDKECGIISQRNEYYRKPFPAKSGHNVFKACFSPGKATVFGIEKVNQDVYNKDILLEIIKRTILTRKFKDFAGDKFSLHTHTVKPNDAERNVYHTILEKFYEIFKKYFEPTGDSKKEAMLKLNRQIDLLRRACSYPNRLDGYNSDFPPMKVMKICHMLSTPQFQGKVAIGCIYLESLNMYEYYLSRMFPNRKVFRIEGDVDFEKRQAILNKFEATENGICLSTQQSLKSSVNIPSCDEVILEALQWNIPKMEQYYFRFIRFDSKNKTRVHFLVYENSIEQNVMSLLLAKEQINNFVQDGEVKSSIELYNEFGVNPSILATLFTREQDEDGNFIIRWGQQKIAA